MVHLSQPLLLLTSLVSSLTVLYAGITEVHGSGTAQSTAIRHVVRDSIPVLASDWRSEMLSLVNSQRALYGRAALTLDNRLNNAAQSHSNYQYSIKTMTHDDPAGTLAQRMTLSGVKWTNAAENVAWNQKTPQEVMATWIRSPLHLTNILGDFNLVGFGEQGLYWTQEFAKGT